MLITLAILSQALLLSMVFQFNRDRSVSVTVRFVVSVAITLWNTLPFFLSLQHLREGGALRGLVSSESYYLVAFLEGLALSVGLWIGLRMQRLSRAMADQLKRHASPSQVQTVVLGVIAAAIAIYVQVFLETSTNYLDINAKNTLETESLWSKWNGVLGGLSVLATAFLHALVAVPTKVAPLSWHVRAGALLAGCTISYHRLLLGSRIHLFLPAMLLAVYALKDGAVRRKRIVIVGVGLLVFGPAVLSVAEYMAEVRQRMTLSSEDLTSALSTQVSLNGGMLSMERLSRQSEMLFVKFDNYRFGWLLYDEAKGRGLELRLTPYIGVASCLIPRSIWPGKPVPGSVDGTYYGVPARYAAGISGLLDRHIGNVGIGAFVASYWQGGILGVLLYLFGVATVISFSVAAGRANNLTGYTLFFWLASLPTMHIMFGTADQIWMRLIQIGAIHLCLLAPALVGLGGAKARPRRYVVLGVVGPEPADAGMAGSYPACKAKS